MILKGIIDYDCVNYKEPVLTLQFPRCSFKCDKLNNAPVCQNSHLASEPNINIHMSYIWDLYKQNPLTKGFCCQGLEPLDSCDELLDFIAYIRCLSNDPIIIYTGYNKDEVTKFIYNISHFGNIIIKWGRYKVGDAPHYDPILGVKLASDNQYAERF